MVVRQRAGVIGERVESRQLKRTDNDIDLPQGYTLCVRKRPLCNAYVLFCANLLFVSLACSLARSFAHLSNGHLCLLLLLLIKLLLGGSSSELLRPKLAYIVGVSHAIVRTRNYLISMPVSLES